MFIKTAFTNFKKMYEMCDFHAAREYHNDAIDVCDAFVVTMSCKQESVLVQLREGARETIQIRRKKLWFIIETIVLCGHQNINLHGHQDSSSDIEGEQAAGKNHGIFWALLNFRISAGDTTLSDHLNSAVRNITYASPDIQNQLINILGDQICGMILRKVCNSSGFALIADEVTDCSNKEQFCIVLRYVDPETNAIREDLVTVSISSSVLYSLCFSLLKFGSSCFI